MFKAFWLMLCPIVYFAKRIDNANEDLFCQISGFFLVAAIEASDIAVLMVAIHTALFVLRPRPSGGETGLYPYRKFAYAVWFIVPFAMAAVVPLSGGHFVDIGSHCYLPTDPSWYRAVLSWVPRYIIFAIIIIVYTWTYFYVSCRFRRLRMDHRRASIQSNRSTQRKRHDRKFSREVPPTPPISKHGLLYSDPASRRGSAIRGRQQSISSTVSTLKPDENTTAPPSRHRQGSKSGAVSWNWGGVNYDGANSHFPQSRGPLSRPVSPTTETFDIEIAYPAIPEPVRQAASCSPQTSIPLGRRVFWRRTLTLGGSIHNPNESSLHIRTILRGGPPKLPENDESPSSQSVYLSPVAAEGGLAKFRGKMRRQLRLLFVYPLMYIIMWIVPFVSHVYKYNEKETGEQPFALQAASVASLCIGAAVDCCFFIAWERPWRHVKGGFWSSLTSLFRRESHEVRNMGRSREEQLRDVRHALNRRNHEQAEREAVAVVTKSRPRRPVREWWDVIEETEYDQVEDSRSGG